MLKKKKLTIPFPDMSPSTKISSVPHLVLSQRHEHGVGGIHVTVPSHLSECYPHINLLRHLIP